MLPASKSHVRHPVEFALLLGLAISMPMFEGMKNLFWGLYAVAWYTNRLRHGVSWEALGGRWDGWDTLFTLVLVTAPAGAAFAGLSDQQWIACQDTLRMISVMWFIKRSGYGDAEWLRLLVTLQVAVVVASLWALAALPFPHTYEGIQLNSVGHVNQSVIYIVICFGALVGGVAAYWRAMSTAWRCAGLVAMAVLLVAIFASGSRAGAATAIVGAVAFGVLWRKRSLWPIVWTGVVIAAFAAAVSTLDTDMRRKQEFALDSPHPVLNERYPIWLQALATWRAFPLFGVGGDNFGDITPARVQGWEAAEGKRYDPATFVKSSHAHNLYLNTLAEHGVLGAAMLAVFCVAWSLSLLRGRPAVADPPLKWFVWSGAASGLVVTLGLGVFNTTLHDEHGLLALMLFGMWLAYQRGAETPRRRA
jgi:O-antigen ligase